VLVITKSDPNETIGRNKKAIFEMDQNKESNLFWFYWQDGYGIFSVNPTETDIVVKYIENQQEHHKKITFKDEFRAFLKKYNVDYDERYIWD
jgi:putative transposase